MKYFFTSILLLGIITSSTATIRIITCQNVPSHFLPLTCNAVVGDTIHWTWVAGTHVVGPMTAADIPAGAAMFNAPVDAGNTSFEYVVTVVGNYDYQCHPATPHGEPGYIVVSAATAGMQENTLNNFSTIYPNPFIEKITIETKSAANSVFIYNAIGEKMQSYNFVKNETKLEADLGTLPKGIFFYSIIKDGVVVETRKIIKD
jgi:plastocyanin